MPFFSIVIPTYNRADFIAATLRSVLAQTFTDLEVIVVDDGSKDHTAEVVNPFLADPRLHYLPKLNEERGKARNYGLACAKGEYVLFLDSDDLFHPIHLATLRQAIEEQQPNFVATKYNFDRNGHIAPSDLALLPAGHYGFDFFVHGNALACNICVRRTNPNLHLFEEDRGYAAVEDWMFMLENTQQDTVYLVDAVTLTMNDHDQRSMRADNSGLVRRLTAAAGWMQQRLHMSAPQMRQLLGHVHYLCAIHSYMDGHRRAALSHWRHANNGVSWRRQLPLLIRIVAGATLMDKLKKQLT